MEGRNRYSTSGNPEAQFEPGSRGRVLKNRGRITSVRTMEAIESWCLADLYKEVASEYGASHRFTGNDVRELHRRWLYTVYSWAGQYRTVQMSKGGFPFAVPLHISTLMTGFSNGPLKRCTPCQGMNMGALASALAEVHVELVLIHPFREGNGRIARLLADLMARQAGRPLLNFRSIENRGRKAYFAAIRAGLDRDYAPMARTFRWILDESK